jgi:hypothetical protein
VPWCRSTITSETTPNSSDQRLKPIACASPVTMLASSKVAYVTFAGAIDPQALTRIRLPPLPIPRHLAVLLRPSTYYFNRLAGWSVTVSLSTISFAACPSIRTSTTQGQCNPSQPLPTWVPDKGKLASTGLSRSVKPAIPLKRAWALHLIYGTALAHGSDRADVKMSGVLHVCPVQAGTFYVDMLSGGRRHCTGDPSLFFRIWHIVDRTGLMSRPVSNRRDQ